MAADDIARNGHLAPSTFVARRSGKLVTGISAARRGTAELSAVGDNTLQVRVTPPSCRPPEKARSASGEP
jgi:hypothetical protein